MKPGYSINPPPAHWGTSVPPASWNNVFLTWSWGDYYLKSSQCGQAELISFLWRKCNISRKSGYIDIGANDGITLSSTALLAALGFLKVDAEGCEQIILTDIIRGVPLSDLPAFIEVENNYRDQVCHDILKYYFSLVCVMDSFVEVYCRNDLASLCHASTIEFFKRLSYLDN